MALKTKVWVCENEGRDNGKSYLITEMPCEQAEDWAMRALLAIGRSGANIPDDVLNSGMAGIASITLRAFFGLDPNEARVLMAEMFQCVRIIPDPSRPSVSRPLIDGDIEEVATRLMLRSEIMEIHLGFSLADGLSKFRQFTSAGPELSSDAPTSPTESPA